MSDVGGSDLIGPVYRGWVCTCGHVWTDRPRHITCAQCRHLIRELELVPRSTAAFYKHERDRANRALEAAHVA